MRLSHIIMYFKDPSDDDVKIVITRQEAYLSPYGTDPTDVVSTKMVRTAKALAGVVGWNPFFLDIDEEEEF